jgi:hypothetical protein
VIDSGGRQDVFKLRRDFAQSRERRPAVPSGRWAPRTVGYSEPRVAAGRYFPSQAGQPDHVLQIAWRAQHRLHRVHHRLRERGKPANVATIAAARELAGFLWAAATAP